MTKRPSVERRALRIAEVSAALGVSRWTVQRLVAAGELATTKVASTTVITVEELESYLRRHTTRARR